MEFFLKEKSYNPNNLSLHIKSVFSVGSKNFSKNDQAEQIKKSISQVELMYNELKSDYL